MASIVDLAEYRRLKRGDFTDEDLQKYSIEELLEFFYGKDFDEIDPIDGRSIRQHVQEVLDDETVKEMLNYDFTRR